MPLDNLYADCIIINIYALQFTTIVIAIKIFEIKSSRKQLYKQNKQTGHKAASALNEEETATGSFLLCTVSLNTHQDHTTGTKQE